VENVGRRQVSKAGQLGGFVELGSRSLNGLERNVLYHNLGPGRRGVTSFIDVAYVTGSDRIEDGRGAAIFDIENDGDLDILIQNFGRKTVLLVNRGEGAGHWLEIVLRGTRSHRDAIGARVIVSSGGRKQLREVVSSAGYLVGQSPVCHFGLGIDDRVDSVEILWPSGATSALRDLEVDRRLHVSEDEGERQETTGGR
jgi:hypothetical protein